ncbi:MAG: DNA methyltransferase [Dehalococcoidia bacterium]|nr:DNA methyltransferase [Dehalococcoidia bacterium]
MDKLAYLREAKLDDIAFDDITSDDKNNWLDQSDSDFDTLIPVADRQTKLAKTAGEERAVFGLYSMGVITARDEWVYDFGGDTLGRKIRSFINLYEESRAEHGGKEVDNDTLGTTIKWTRDLKRQLHLDRPNVFDRASIRQTLFRPFIGKSLYFNQNLNEMQYQLPEVFPTGADNENKAICFCVNGKDFYVLAAEKVFDYHFTGDTQCLPLYRYTSEGKRVSNITEWGLRQFREHYSDDSITAENIFAYTYAVLHDPAYREKYALDLLREFPRLPMYRDFPAWVRMGRELLELHVGFESAEPYPLERVEQAGQAGKAVLRADKDRGAIVLDGKTTLTGVPPEAWEYRLGSRSALEWVLDQYKERKPKDPTIAEKFNTYRFADHKERVIDLLRRVCAVSVRTVEIVGELDMWTDLDPDEGLEFRREFVEEMEKRMSSDEPTIPAEEVYRRLGLE